MSYHIGKLAIVVCATKSYQYAMKTQARRIAACLRSRPANAKAFICGDESVSAVADYWRKTIGIEVQPVVLPINEGGENYKEQAQVRIAQMRAAMHEAALDWGADTVWSLDSDVLPPPNALGCMADTLAFDSGNWYQVAFCTYPNDTFLGGFGAPNAAILPNVYQDEREIPVETKAEGDAIEAEFKKLTPGQQPAKELQDRMDALRKKIEACPATGNVFGLNAKGYRRRGWLEYAYPGVGVGAIVPSDWCGFGCNLMTRRAVELARFEGYEGKGTEDLFICDDRWRPAGIRIACVTHAPCDHVLHMKKKKDVPEGTPEYVHLYSYHEKSGECAGHLRVKRLAWTPEVF